MTWGSRSLVEDIWEIPMQILVAQGSSSSPLCNISNHKQCLPFSSQTHDCLKQCLAVHSLRANAV